MPVAAADMPVKPKAPAIRASTKNIKTHCSIATPLRIFIKAKMPTQSIACIYVKPH